MKTTWGTPLISAANSKKLFLKIDRSGKTLPHLGKPVGGSYCTDGLLGIMTSFGIIDLSTGICRFFQRNHNEVCFTGIME